MSTTVNIDDLGAVVAQTLEEFSEEVAVQVRENVDAVAKQAARELKNTSPKKTGEYAKGWSKRTIYYKRGRYVVQAYNRKKPSLTHLLEYGHKTLDGKTVPAKQHIRPVAEKATRDLLNGIKLGLK